MSVRPLLGTAAVALVVAAGAAAPTPAAAECCVGPWVAVTTRLDAPLAAKVRLKIAGDTPELRYKAVVRPSLLVGRRLIHRFAEFPVSDVGPEPQYRDLAVPRSVRDAAAAYGARTGHRRAVMKFVIVDPTEMATGQSMRTYGMDSFLVLPHHRSDRSRSGAGQ